MTQTVVRPVNGARDRAWIIERHGELYEAECGWDRSFEALVAGVMADYTPIRDAAWIADVGGVRAGSVMCVAKDDQTAKLRLLLVEPWARGRGVGRALVDRCLEFAREAGYERIELWTTANLVAARRLYESCGFTLVREYEEESFGATLNSQEFALALD
jgi:GNAT superfamily N-acetyltransferase